MTPRAGRSPRASPNWLAPHKQYVDVVHPINSACREEIHRAIIAAYEEEKIRAQAPGYVSAYDEYFGSEI